MKKIFYGWWIVLACFLIIFYVASVVFLGFTAFFEPIRKEFGWSYTKISLAASLRGLEMGIFAPFIGVLVDRFGSRKLILSGTITIGFGLLLLSLTQSLAMFYGSFLLIAFGASGCTDVVLTTAVANWFRKKVGVALGVMFSGVGVGGLMIPLIVWLIDVYGWRTALVLLGVGMWILGISVCFVLRNRPEEYGYLPDGELAGNSVSDAKTHGTETNIGLKQALRARSFLYLTVAELIRMTSVQAVITHIMPYLSSIGMSRSTAGLIAAASPLMSIVGRFGFGWLADIFPKRFVIAGAYSLGTLGLLALSYIEVTWLIIPFLLFFPLFWGVIALRGAIVREYFGRKAFGKILGILTAVTAIGGSIGPILVGWVFDTLGSYRVIWLVFSGLNSLAVWVLLKMK